MPEYVSIVSTSQTEIVLKIDDDISYQQEIHFFVKAIINNIPSNNVTVDVLAVDTIINIALAPGSLTHLTTPGDVVTYNLTSQHTIGDII
jgi:ribosomal protein S25